VPPWRGRRGGAAVDGHAAFIATNPVFGKITRRRHPRYIVAMNATTFRTIRFIVYTAAAYAAIAGGSASRSSSLDSRQPRHSLCPLKLARKCLSPGEPQPGGHLVRQSVSDKTLLFMGSSGVLFFTS